MDDEKSVSERMGEEVFRLWEVYRNYVIHEDLLLSQRLSRMLVVQGVLFTGAGSIAIEFAKGIAQMHRQAAPLPDFLPRFGALPAFIILLLLIGIVGVVAAWLSGGEAQAADDALVLLEKRWNETKSDQADRLNLPGLLRAGKPKGGLIQKEGSWLPKLFIGIWCVLSVCPLGIFVWLYSAQYSLPQSPIAARSQPTPVQVTCTSISPSGNAISTLPAAKSTHRR